MPILQVHLPTGYSRELKARITQSLTALMSGITRSRPETISVQILDIDPALQDQADSVGAGTVDPVTLVRDYLTAMERRELDRAQRLLAENFVMSFPGSGEMNSLAELVEWSAGRYRRVEKSLMSVNVAYETDKVVVFVHGTLSGQWPDGNTFDQVRFIDRFEVRDDRLERQDVWNDLANAMP